MDTMGIRRPGLRPAIISGLVTLGAGLLLRQYIASPSLWLDEIAVAKNILDRSVWDLLGSPLAYDQVAPKGFLLVESLAVTALGRSDYVLRLLPFLSSLTALLVFRSVSILILEESAALIAVVLFVTAAPLVVFASTLKQYSTDIAVSLVLLWTVLALDPRRLSSSRLRWAGVVGAIAVWVSQPAVLAVGAMGAALMVIWWREARWRGVRALAPMLGMWALSASAATSVALASMTPATHAYMNQYWAAGFLPLSLPRALALLWPLDQLRALFGNAAGGAFGALTYPAPEVFIALTIVGFCILWRKQRRTALLLIAPTGVTLAAAIVHQYPFSDRLILFLLPSFFLAIATSIDGLRRLASRWSQPLGWLTAVLLVAPAAYPMLTVPPVYHREDIRPVLAHIQAARHSGDGMYVYFGAAPAVSFYGDGYGLAPGDYAVGGCHRMQAVRYLEELDTFRGRSRVWVVITHAIPALHERENILQYLDTIGVRRDTFAVAPHLVGNRGLPAEAFLYDLNDPGRLGAAAAASFPLIAPTSPDARFVCGAGPDAMVPARGL
jgi:hypothetical protein